MVGEGLVDALADGAASGRPAKWIRARASREDGIRTPKVDREPVTAGAKGDGLGSGRRILNGPGQKREIRES